MPLEIPGRRVLQSNLHRNGHLDHEAVVLRKIVIKVKAEKLLTKNEKVMLVGYLPFNGCIRY
jgi:hypothetical protein